MAAKPGPPIGATRVSSLHKWLAASQSEQRSRRIAEEDGAELSLTRYRVKRARTLSAPGTARKSRVFVFTRGAEWRDFSSETTISCNCSQFIIVGFYADWLCNVVFNWKVHVAGNSPLQFFFVCVFVLKVDFLLL